MKKICIILLLFLTFSCEDVIDVNLKNIEPKLVIDASINWIKDTDGKTQFIKLSLTAPYFNNTIPPAVGAKIIVTDSNNTIFNFNETDTPGTYKNSTFAPKINSTYTLTITYNNEVYTATETLKPVVEIEYIEQKNNGGFTSDETEIKAFYNDPKGIENFYFFEFINTATNALNLDVYDDEFTDGNTIFAIYSDDDLIKGDEIVIKNVGISQRFYQYMNLLIQQTQEASGNPFKAQSAPIRGNCTNQTNPENYPFGYFRVSEVDLLNYTIQ